MLEQQINLMGLFLGLVKLIAAVDMGEDINLHKIVIVVLIDRQISDDGEGQ